MTITAETTVTFTLADGESREAERIVIGDEYAAGIMCPFCQYPSEGAACGNPMCDTWCDAAGLAARRTAERERQAERERRAGIARFMDAQRQEARERAQAEYDEAMAKARDEGYCGLCVSHSMRHGGTAAKFTRHRDEANCPQSRRWS